MKKLLSALTVLLCIQTAVAQVKEGKITYEQKVDMHRRIPEDNQQMRSMVPPFRTAKYELLFGDNQSLFKAVEEEPDLTEENNGGVVIRIGGGADNEYYKNFTTKRAVESREMMQEIYLVDDSLRSITWKLEEGETKTILGYTCKKATGKTERGSEIVAWYAEEIPVAAGPDQFNGLPGMILGIDANKGEIVFTAVSLDKKADIKKIKAPTKGKKMTNAEFVAKQKELFGNQPGGVRIVTN
ncbi:MAG TPA: GLPGLI family protein [Ferruginibacter sp.]|jgi:GLPGLI family protein|nr:GLPGLI family protein [Ferruginibacter sp.]